MTISSRRRPLQNVSAGVAPFQNVFAPASAKRSRLISVIRPETVFTQDWSRATTVYHHAVAKINNTSWTYQKPPTEAEPSFRPACHSQRFGRFSALFFQLLYSGKPPLEFTAVFGTLSARSFRTVLCAFTWAISNTNYNSCTALKRVTGKILSRKRWRRALNSGCSSAHTYRKSETLWGPCEFA